MRCSLVYSTLLLDPSDRVHCSLVYSALLLDPFDRVNLFSLRLLENPPSYYAWLGLRLLDHILIAYKTHYGLTPQVLH